MCTGETLKNLKEEGISAVVKITLVTEYMYVFGGRVYMCAAHFCSRDTVMFSPRFDN